MKLLRDIDELKLYRGDDYVLPNGVKIQCPTLGQICDYGESKYLSMLSIFTSTTIDRCAQLDDMGIDYTQITNFQMFAIIFSHMLTTHPDENQIDTSLLLGDLNFAEFVVAENEKGLCLVNPKTEILFDSDVFEEMTSYIRKMHGIPQPLYTNVKDGFAKKQLIIDARNDADFQRKLHAIKGEHSQYLPYISALVNHPNFKYGWDDVWNMKVYAFFDSLKRISIIDNANHLYQGLYSGCIEYNKIKKDLDWLKPID